MTPPRSSPASRAHHDAPHEGRALRVYYAITNDCNRACPWCSVSSRPGLSTYLPLDRFVDLLPREGRFEAQLEGGEPTLHPRLLDMVRAARATGRCERIVLSTNGVRVPSEPAAIERWLASLGEPLTIKLSVNHHLLEADARGIERAQALRRAVDARRDGGADVALVINLRRRRRGDGDAWVRDAVERAGLLDLTNDFFLQRYGLARDDATLDPPHLAGTRFLLVNPDGSTHGTDLVARSEAMGRLP